MFASSVQPSVETCPNPYMHSSKNILKNKKGKDFHKKQTLGTDLVISGVNMKEGGGLIFDSSQNTHSNPSRSRIARKHKGLRTTAQDT